MTFEKPIISVIVSTYNSERFIRGRIEDLIKQTIFEKIEVIIINSGSEQSEEDIVIPFIVKYPNIFYIRTDQRETIYKAWNRAVKLAKGKYITNANTDDRLRCDAFEMMVKEFQKRENVGLVYADQFVTSNPNVMFECNKLKKKLKRPSFSRLNLLENYLAGSQSMWLASIHFGKNIWFNESLEVAGDYDFVCRIAEEYKILKINKVLGLYFKSGKNENKEYQNINRTIKETFDIQDLYTRRYFNALCKRQKRKYSWLFEFLTIIPHNIYAVTKRTIDFICPNNRIIQRYKLFWFASVFYECFGNLKKAKSFCKPYLYLNCENLIKYQYQKLDGLNNNVE